MPGQDYIAEAIGLSRYAIPGDGIGGMLKTRVVDFRVEEEIKAPSLDPRGRFTVARITLTNWETNRFINRLAKILRMSRDRIWFAGTKDKRAVTRQLFVIDAKLEKVKGVEIPDAEIEIIGRTHQKIGFGSHRGNTFTIVVRGCCDSSGEPLSETEALERIEHLRTGMEEVVGVGLFPNWVGPQRFGASRPVTAKVGRHVIDGDFEGAVRCYLGMEGIGESEEIQEFRAMIRDGKDFAEALEKCPERLGFEANMLKRLVEKEGDWVGAFLRLPRNLQLMMVHALQSEFFNRALH
ncbi:MAG: tRNA pseudouridine(13) synthase TruD, partial [Candidatus Poseidoniaceae archaeon]|nr:tRNA pseudouridine(13) synthase TruD [Candidatus Poseidoniaceae archaeon]